MRTLILISLLTIIASCGKDSKSSKNNNSISALHSQGIIVQSNGSVITVSCQNTGTTNDQRIATLNGFMNNMPIVTNNQQYNYNNQYNNQYNPYNPYGNQYNNQYNTQYVDLNGVQVDPNRLRNVLSQAMMRLQQSSYQQMPYGYNQYNQQYNQYNQYQNMNTMCPSGVLAQG